MRDFGLNLFNSTFPRDVNYDLLNIRENILLTIPGPIVEQTKTVRRTWKERLFSLPWTPLIKLKEITEKIQTQLPDPNLYVIGNTIIVGHPSTVLKLKKSIKSLQK